MPWSRDGPAQARDLEPGGTLPGVRGDRPDRDADRSSPHSCSPSGICWSIATFPIWWPVTRRYVGTRAWLFLGLLCIPAGRGAERPELGRPPDPAGHQRDVDGADGEPALQRRLHALGQGTAQPRRLGGHASASASSWASRPITALFATNPWKFGMRPARLHPGSRAGPDDEASVGGAARRPSPSASCPASPTRRSFFALFLLTAALLGLADATQGEHPTRIGLPRDRRPRLGGRGGLQPGPGHSSWTGCLGEETQQRTAQQIGDSGNLILGGRPEIAATAEPDAGQPARLRLGHHPQLQRHPRRPSRAWPTSATTRTTAMSRSGCSATGTRCTPAFGDLLGHLRSTRHRLHRLHPRLSCCAASAPRWRAAAASGALIFISSLTIWNIFFAPSYSGMKMLILILALSFIARPAPPPDPLARPRRRYWPVN